MRGVPGQSVLAALCCEHAGGIATKGDIVSTVHLIILDSLIWEACCIFWLVRNNKRSTKKSEEAVSSCPLIFGDRSN